MAVCKILILRSTNLWRVKYGKQAVSARELYLYLGYDKSQYSRWYQKNIEVNQFAIKDVDFQAFDIMSNGNPSKDFALLLDFVKNQDFEVFDNFIRNPQGGRPLTEYILSMDCAKEI